MDVYLTKRKELLVKEKELQKKRDELAALRRELPRVKIEKTYSFETGTGRKTLAELFDNKSQLIIQHFMFDDATDAKPCNSCSFWVDSLNGATKHIQQRDTEYVIVAKADIDMLMALRSNRQWFHTKFASSKNSTFNKDMGVEFSDRKDKDEDVMYNFKLQKFPSNQAPGFSVFFKDDNGNIFLTYNTFARGADPLNSAYQLLDLLPKGRDEANLPYSMGWVKPWTDYKDVDYPCSPITVEIVSKNAIKHIEWMTKAFDANLVGELFKNKEGHVMHSMVNIYGGAVFVVDGVTKGEETEADKPRLDTIYLMLSNIDGLYKQAVANGASVKTKLHDAFWGARYAVLVDPFGVEWALHGDLREEATMK